MKKIALAFFAVLILISCKKEVSKNNLHLTGNIKGLKSGTVYIQKNVDTSFVVIDTLKIEGDSKFETNIELKSPEMLYLFLDRGVTNSLDDKILFFAEPGSIHIETNLEMYNASAKITGSKNHQKYEEYKKINTRFRDLHLDLIQKKFIAMKTNNAKALDSLNLIQETNTKKKYLYATNFAVNNGEYELAPYIALTDIYDINIAYLDTIQRAMSTKVQNSMYGKRLNTYINQIKKKQ